MKLENRISLRYRPKLIRQFGRAKLVKLPTGQHELIGATGQDRTPAFEWASLCAHEIVFTDFHREETALEILRFPRLQAPNINTSNLSSARAMP